MTTPNTKNGITKDSTLLINVNPYLPNNYKQTLNYVGYWKWDSTNQTFIQVLNNQDIIDEKYNLKIQPLFYDADTGLPQKVTVNSGDTKRLKMINDNNDGSMEPTEYVEPNLMVKFNSKTRSITEYPYFEVEALPPTITSPITSNGYYKFDGNTLISGTSSDYNLNINIPPSPSKINIKSFSFDNSNIYSINSLNSSSTKSVSVPTGNTMISFSENNENYIINFVCNRYPSTVSRNIGIGSKYIIVNSLYVYLYLYDNYNNIITEENYWATGTSSMISNDKTLNKNSFNLMLN